eukprot:359696_1
MHIINAHASMTFQIEVKGNKIVPFQRRHSVSIPLQYKQYTKHNERAPSLPIKSKSNSPKTSKKQNLPKPKPKQSQYPQSDPPITSIADTDLNSSIVSSDLLSSSSDFSAHKALKMAKKRIRNKRKREKEAKLKAQKEQEIIKQKLQISAQHAQCAMQLAKKRIHQREELKKIETNQLNERHAIQQQEERKRVSEAVNLAKRRVEILSIQEQAQRRWSLDAVLSEITNETDAQSTELAPVNCIAKNRKLTFLSNRCNYLQEIMKKDGWVQCDRDSKLPADFTYWASSSIHAEKRGALSQLPR